MSDEGDFPKTDDDLAASTKRLADWTFSLQDVGADLKTLMNEFKAYWRGLMPTAAEGISMAALIPEPDEQSRAGGIRMRQGSNVNYSPTVEHSKLLPWLMLCSILAGFALGLAGMTIIDSAKTEARLHAEIDRQYRYLQELRIRVEDAENATQKVNPNFTPHR